MKRAILFDFWQTLVSDTRERLAITTRENLVAEFLAAHGIDPLTTLPDAFEDARKKFFQVYTTQQRTASVKERLHWIFAFFHLEFDDAQLKHLEPAIAEAGLLFDPEPTPHIKEILATLSKDYLLGIVSDTGYTPSWVLRKHLRKHGMFDYFDAFSFSDETGHAKPHPQAFMIALEQLGISPRDAIHCGDLPKHDILGANKLGMTSVLYTGHHAVALDGIKPDYILSNWHELPTLVAEIFS